MKLTVFGLTLSSSWGNGHATPYRALFRALHDLGHEIVFYEQEAEYYAHRRDFQECDYCRLVFYPSWDEVRKWALADSADSDAVMVGSYVPEGARINDEILELSRPTHIFYDLDTPITLAGLEKNTDNGHRPPAYLRRDQIKEFDLYLSFTGGRILQELEQRWGARRALALHGCVDPDIHRRVAMNSDFRCDLSYMGTYAADRQQNLEDLFMGPARALADRRFVIAGSMYPWEWSWPANVRRFEHVAPAEHPALYSSSRTTLNITRKGMAARGGFCPSGRFFEAAACGTPILTDWFEGLDHFFAPGEEIFVVHSTDDVIAALRCPDAELSRLAARALQRTLQEHTGMCRARQFLAYMHSTIRASRQMSIVN